MSKLYNHGLPFSKPLDQNIDDLMERIDKDKASLLVIDGGVGEGKTTLGIECCDYACKEETDCNIQYGMGGLQFQEKLQLCHLNKKRAVIYDESGDFSKRGTLTQFNKRLIRIFETYRAYKILIILIVPNFYVLDQSLMDLKIPRLLLNCYKRGDRDGTYRAYSLYRMHYLRHKMRDQRLVIKEFAYSQVKPNFRGHFLDLSPDRARELRRICLAGKEKIVTESILEASNLVNIATLCRKLSRSSIWVRQKLKKLGIKHSTIYKKKKYYELGAFELLRDQIAQK